MLDEAARLAGAVDSLYGAGRFKEAVPLAERSLELREKALGGMHSDVATSSSNPLFALSEKVIGEMNLVIASSLNSLGMIYMAQGAYGRAEGVLVRGISIYDKTLGSRHPDVATNLNNLARLYDEQGAYHRAELLGIRALAIQEKALGAMHPDVANSLSSLAGLYRDQGAYFRSGPLYARAEPLFIRALAIQEKALGTMHPDVAISLDNLGWLYDAQGADARAAPLYVRALAIREKTLGPMHPHIALSLNSLATLYQEQGAYRRAAPLYFRAAEVREANLRSELPWLSESSQWNIMMRLRRETERLVSFHAHAMPTSAQALELALTTVLRRKGRVLDSLAEHQAALRAHLIPQLSHKLGQLAEANFKLLTRLRAPYEPRTAPSQAAALAALRSRIHDLQAEVNAASVEEEPNAASVEYRAQSAPVTVAKVQAALPRGAALVELARYHRYDARQAKSWQEARYLAYLLPWQGPPQWVPLGEADPIDACVDAVLATMRKGVSADVSQAALRSLDALVFAPIRSRLVGVSHVILSPDSKLNLVPFEALNDPQGHYALEQWLISYVTSGRDLLRMAVKQASRSPVTIVADPDYGPGQAFVRLPGMGAEGQEIAAYLRGARVLTGEQATKAALAGVVGPAVLHIATHGFYARGAAMPAWPAVAERGMSVEAMALPPLLSYLDPSDALDRAGLALAGANSGSDGITSARQLASYDLWGTQLVVLSACETGVGEVQSGEGVYGMRRALVLAGAQAQVVSLWNVNDGSARMLMRAFYGELARGTGRAQALRQAKLALLHQPQFAHPYYWAAFIAAGDWTPLDKDTLRKQEPSR